MLRRGVLHTQFRPQLVLQRHCVASQCRKNYLVYSAFNVEYHVIVQWHFHHFPYHTSLICY